MAEKRHEKLPIVELTGEQADLDNHCVIHLKKSFKISIFPLISHKTLPEFPK